MTARLRSTLAVLACFAIALGAVAFDAARRTGPDPALLAAIVEATGSSDLALSSGSRWLRHPSVVEPAAACLGPTCLDTDPAGLAIPPPPPRAGGTTIVRVPVD